MELLIMRYKLLKLGLITEAMRVKSMTDLSTDTIVYFIGLMKRSAENHTIKVTEGSLADSPTKKKLKLK